MTPMTDPMAAIAQKRETFERLRASLVACGRSLSECGCWHYEPDRLDAIARIGGHIQHVSSAMQTLLEDIQRLERQILGA